MQIRHNGKIGLEHYNASILASGHALDAAPAEALVPLPLYISMPFAATMIRASMGLVGFVALLLLFERDGKAKLRRAVRDRKAMWCDLGATVFGPFVGVSMSLLATMYTSTGIAQTLFALTPILIIAPSVWLFHQRVTPPPNPRSRHQRGGRKPLLHLTRYGVHNRCGRLKPPASICSGIANPDLNCGGLQIRHNRLNPP